MNAAFLLALNYSNVFDCVIFHDVDLLPETDTNIYGCANSPAHLSVSIDAYGYRLVSKNFIRKNISLAA